MLFSTVQINTEFEALISSRSANQDKAEQEFKLRLDHFCLHLFHAQAESSLVSRHRTGHLYADGMF